VKKLYCLLRGGLGNQLFIFAACYAAAKRSQSNLVLDCVTGFKRDWRYRREFALSNFKLREKYELITRLNLSYCTFLYFAKALRKLNLSSVYLREVIGHEIDEQIFQTKRSTSQFMLGSWQSEDYFKEFAEELRMELSPVEMPSDRTQLLFNILDCTPVIGVHIRNFNSSDQALQNAVTKDYFENAIAKIRDEYDNNIPVWICSNDQTHAEELMQEIGNCTFIKLEEHDAAFWEMQILSKCRYFIGSNSTFSWWCAWLNEETKHAVIFPDIRITGEADWGFEGLLPSRWTTLSTGEKYCD